MSYAGVLTPHIMSNPQRPRLPYLRLEFLADLPPELEDPRPLYVHRPSSSASLPLKPREWNNGILGPQKYARPGTAPSTPPQKHKPSSLSLDENKRPSTAQACTPQRKIRPLPPLPSSSHQTSSSCSRPRPRPLPSPPLSAPPVLPTLSPPPIPRARSGILLSPPLRCASLPTLKRQRLFIISNPDPETPEPEPEPEPERADIHITLPQESSPPQVKLHLTIPNSTQRPLSITVSPVSTNPGSPLVFHVPDASSPLTIDNVNAHSVKLDFSDNEDKITDSDSSEHELTKLGDFEHTIFVEAPIHLHGASWDGEKRGYHEDEDDDSAVDDGTDEEWELSEGMTMHVGRHSKLVTKKWVIEQGKKRWTQEDYQGIIEALRML